MRNTHRGRPWRGNRVTGAIPSHANDVRAAAAPRDRGDDAGTKVQRRRRGSRRILRLPHAGAGLALDAGLTWA